MSKTLLSKYFFLLALFIMPLVGFTQNNQEKPFVIPELKEWKGTTGFFKPLIEKSKIIVPKGNSELLRIGKLLSDDYKSMFGIQLTVSEGNASNGDIVLHLKKDKTLGIEGYEIKISNKLEIFAPEAKGIFWATRTILQMSEQSEKRELPCGTIRDFPDYKLRGFVLDCGRKFIPLHFLKDYLKFMAYYKMNTFQIHLNDNAFKKYYNNNWDQTYSAFRLESETYPGLAAEDGHYTKQEFKDLQKLAENYSIEIIPEIDIPAHSLAFYHYLPEIGSKEYGEDHLDLFKPETYAFLDKLFDEYLKGDDPVFRGKYVHIGTDEYSNKKKEVVEKFRYFTDYYIKYIEKYGKKTWLWGALTHADGDTPVKVKDVMMQIWYNPYAQPDAMLEKGYEIISIPDGLVYIVPNAGYYYNYLNNEELYKKWTPNVVGEKVYTDKDPRIAGGMFAVWNDKSGNGITTKDIHQRVFASMQTLSTKMWTGTKTSLPYDEFNTKRLLISEAPDVNIAGKIKGNPNSLVYEQAIVTKNSKLPYKEIGYNYTVSFDVEVSDENKGTILFSSQNATFYLSDPIRSQLGFTTEGYFNTLDYGLKPGQKVTIEICGNENGTCMAVNGKIKKMLAPKTLWFDDKGKDDMKIVSTLAFPLDTAGNFNSKISNLKVYNFCKYEIK